MAEYLEYPKNLLNLEYTLNCGQAFRWQIDADGWWGAPVCGKVLRIRSEQAGFKWETTGDPSDERLFCHYFRMDEDVRAIYDHLAQADDHLADLVQRFGGLRLVRQEPAETLLSFICSAANSIPRISKAVEALSASYGTFIAEIADRRYYSFPGVESLAAADPQQLQKTGGLGWRGESIVAVAEQVLSKPNNWLISLRDASYDEAKAELMTIRGVGAKIADCVCLFSLEKNQAVPVDTHIRQVAERLFMPHLKTKSVTAAAYKRITEAFFERYGQYAGWAQEFLYYEDIVRARSRKKK